MTTAMEHPVNDSTLRVEYSRDLPAMTTAGPVRAWRVMITTPTFVHEAEIGIASGSDEVSQGLFATIVDMGLFTVQPGSRQ